MYAIWMVVVRFATSTKDAIPTSSDVSICTTNRPPKVCRNTPRAIYYGSRSGVLRHASGLPACAAFPAASEILSMPT